MGGHRGRLGGQVARGPFGCSPVRGERGVDEVGEGYGCAGEVVGAAEFLQFQQRVGQVDQTLDLGVHGAQGVGEFAGGAGAVQGDVEFGADQGERGAQFMAGVRDEPALAFGGRLQAVEHVVEGVAETGDLVVPVAGHVQAQMLGTVGEGGGPAAVSLDGAQGGAGGAVADVGGGDQGQAGGEGELSEEFAQRLVAVAAPHGGDHDPGLSVGGDAPGL